MTLPGLRNEVLVAFVLTTINALRSFDIVYNTTSGGPGNKTIVPSMYMYQNAFLFNRVGYAAAIATCSRSRSSSSPRSCSTSATVFEDDDRRPTRPAGRTSCSARSR